VFVIWVGFKRHRTLTVDVGRMLHINLVIVLVTLGYPSVSILCMLVLSSKNSNSSFSMRSFWVIVIEFEKVIDNFST